MFIAAGRLVTYPAPKGAAGNSDFTVRVRPLGGEWQELFCYNVKVDMHDVRNASMVYFDCSGSMEVEVTKNEGTIEEAVLRPLSAGLACRIDGSRITFRLDGPRKLSLEVNGDRFHNLHIFANPMETDAPDPSDPGVVVFKPGVHRTEDIIRLITTPLAEGEGKELCSPRSFISSRACITWRKRCCESRPGKRSISPAVRL